MTASRSSVRFVALLLGGAVLSTRPSAAQVADIDLRTSVFHEPSPRSKMTVLNPSAALGVRPAEFLRIDAGWSADIVSGASEGVKAGPLVANPDIVSAASVHDTRHVVSGGLSLLRDNTTLSASYGYGSENDYRSNSISVSAGTDFFQRNSQILLAYAHGFDSVCDRANARSLDPTLRVALDSSKGCFSDDPLRAQRDLALDSFQGTWTQAWTPALATQLTLTGQLQHGFLGNPYRAVVVGATGQIAQEHHPENRARMAAALRAKYYVRGLKSAITLGVRGYDDSWDVLSQTYELEVERYLLPWLRVLARGRYYRQTGALFWSDDYTGGEPQAGPRGQYWTGDRELSPLSSWLVGGRAVASWTGAQGARLGGVFLRLETSASFDFVKTNLREFTWAGTSPDDTVALIGALGVGGAF